ncbi:MAG: fumarylacetoacetate hydrolase family protein [Desulfobacteraceae bacterium]|nr:fumarylacetoacetate hydrolase family protein [Desulfobacteraceae bacterium]
MKIRQIMQKGKSQPEVAIYRQDRWVPLTPALAGSGLAEQIGDPVCCDVVSLLALSPEKRQEVEKRVDDYVASGVGRAAEYEDTPVLPFFPASYRDFMLFEQHVIGAARGFARQFMPRAYRLAGFYEKIFKKTFPKFRPHPLWYQRPIYYMGNHLNFVAEGYPVAFPPYSRALDYELEIGAVIARPVKNASAQRALEAIGGFVVFNDFSARDVQLAEMRSGFGPVKAKHFANAISQTVVSADEILPHLDTLKGQVMINGELVVESSAAGMYHSLGQAVAYASLEEQLHAGELIGSGTLPGGCAMENGRWLKPGDTITLKIDHIGTLSNPITTRSSRPERKENI